MKTYWYIKFDGLPVHLNGWGGFEVPDGTTRWLKGIFDRTCFPTKKIAKEAVQPLLKNRAKWWIKKFKFVKVTVK